MSGLSERGEVSRIGKLRLSGVSGESGLVRSRVTNILRSMDFERLGMQPAAVLIVRHLADPLPGGLALHGAAGRMGAAWEVALRERLTTLHRHAARPAHATVAPGAAAVLFADEAELLATLALDLVRGDLRQFWWWRALLRSLPLDSPSALASVLRQRARWVPAAFAILARQNRVLEVIRALTPRDAFGVLATVAQSHDVSELAGRLIAPRPPDTDARVGLGVPARILPRGTTPGVAAAGHGAALNEHQAPVSERDAPPTRQRPPDLMPPWLNGLAPRMVPPDLSREQACLLGVSLMLHHRPESVRSIRFVTQLERWWRAGVPVQGEPRGPSAAGCGAAPPPPETAAARASANEREGLQMAPRDLADEAVSANDTASGVVGTRGGDPRTVASRSAGVARVATNPTGRDDLRRGSEHEPTIAVGAYSSASVVRAEQQEATGARATRGDQDDAPSGIPDSSVPVLAPRAFVEEPCSAPQSSPIARTSSSTDSWLVLEGGVDTGLAGVLLLINLMCRLDLPACFEDEWELASNVGSWGVLLALARALLAADAAAVNDPIWLALEMLCGRAPGERLGAGLRPGAAFYLPASWAAQALAGCKAPADGNEPAAVSEAGFHDAPLAILAAKSLIDIDRKLGSWLALVLPFLVLRLARALGVAPSVESLKEALLVRRGRLYVTATHVDLVMPLSTVSVPVRVAGLDRSPGWLSDFGRVILFHFE